MDAADHIAFLEARVLRDRDADLAFHRGLDEGLREIEEHGRLTAVTASGARIVMAPVPTPWEWHCAVCGRVVPKEAKLCFEHHQQGGPQWLGPQWREVEKALAPLIARLKDERRNQAANGVTPATRNRPGAVAGNNEVPDNVTAHQNR